MRDVRVLGVTCALAGCRAAVCCVGFFVYSVSFKGSASACKAPSAVSLAVFHGVNADREGDYAAVAAGNSNLKALLPSGSISDRRTWILLVSFSASRKV